jgi:hypothetical protein
VRSQTQKCKEYQHPEISVCCDPTETLSPSMRWLLSWVEDEVANGRRFLAGQTVQLGWSLLKVHQRDDATLALFEPDFKSMPMELVDSVSNTLLHLLLQKSVAESLGVEEALFIPSLRESAVICCEFGSTDGFVMNRVAPKPGVSGWFLGCDNEAHNHQALENLRRTSLYEAAVRHDNRIIPFLGLPHDMLIGFSKGVPNFFRDDKELVIRPNSYLHKKYLDRP